MKEDLFLEMNLKSHRLPYPGYLINRTRPEMSIATSKLVELIEMGIIGSFPIEDYFNEVTIDYDAPAEITWEEMNKRSEEIFDNFSVGIKLFKILPILTHMVDTKKPWSYSNVAKPWELAVEFVQDFNGNATEWLANLNETKQEFLSFCSLPEDFPLSKEVLGPYFLDYANLFKMSYPWMERDSTEFVDFKLFHQLLYYLLARSSLMPSKKEAKKQSQEGYVKLSGWLIVNSKPLENLIYDPDFREKKVAELQRWINSTISERKMEEEVSLNRGFLKKKPLLKEVSVDKFSRKLSASLLRILLDSFNCEDGFYSNGQLYIGLCHFCGKIFVKNKITQKFCPNNTPDCRKKFNKAKEREIKKNGDF